MIRSGTWNLFCHGSRDRGAADRAQLVREVVTGLDVDILAVQELTAADEEEAGARLENLVSDAGMTCLVNGEPAVARGHAREAAPERQFTGLAWRRATPMIPGTVVRIESGELWHSLIRGTFDLAGFRMHHASYHGTPSGRYRRVDEMERVVMAMTRNTAGVPGVIGADWNAIGADPRENGEYYDLDPFASMDMSPEIMPHCDWVPDVSVMTVRHRADRRPGEVLYFGGLYDVAASVNAPWMATFGHFAERPGRVPRRLDAVRVTGDLKPFLIFHEVVDTIIARRASDHLPVVVGYDVSPLANSVA